MTAVRVYNGLFGPDLALAALRMGDLIAVCNFLEYIRTKTNFPKLQMYIPDEVVYPSEHCLKFRDFLGKQTDYITVVPEELIELEVVGGTDVTYPTMYNIWNIRKDVSIKRQDIFHIDDKVEIINTLKREKHKIVVCPLTDAPYNAFRNWTLHLTQTIINSYRLYDEDYKKIIISKEPIEGLDIKDFEYSHDFDTNLSHVMTCSSFIGGDTGFSHFAGALNEGPIYLNYYYSKETYGTTFPFNWKTKGRVYIFDEPKYKLNNGIEYNEAFQRIK